MKARVILLQLAFTLSLGHIAAFSPIARAQATAPQPPEASRQKPVHLLTRAEADAIVNPAIGDTTGALTVGLICPEGQAVYGYGKTSNAPDAGPPDGKTLFEIASVTKLFTGLLLAQAVDAGKLNLDDPVQKLLPSSVAMPQWETRPITLLDLATHTSGLPRMPDNNRIGRQTFTPQQLYEFLGRYKLKAKPGEEYVYSNLGAALLGHALARKAGMTNYEQLVVERICKPLDMQDTKITYTPQMIARLARNYDPNGKVTPPTFATLVDGGGGSLRSTPDDMLKFLSAELGLTPTPFDSAIKLSQQPQRDGENHMKVGLFWNMRADGPRLFKNGKLDGYLSYVVINPGRKTGVAVLCTRGYPDGAIADKVISAMLGQIAEPPKSPATGEIESRGE